jgi:hypothetical protein
MYQREGERGNMEHTGRIISLVLLVEGEEGAMQLV